MLLSYRYTNIATCNFRKRCYYNNMEEKYNLKKFVGVGSRSGDYFISFNKSGLLISSGFYSQEKIIGFSKVVLYFDEKKVAVGLQFVRDNNAEGGFKLIHGNNKTTGSVSARSFVKTNNLNNPKYFGRKVPKKIDYQGSEIFVIDLVGDRQDGKPASTIS